MQELRFDDDIRFTAVVNSGQTWLRRALGAHELSALGDARALIAVSAASNRSKAGQHPAMWLPSAAGCRCQ
ncbi:hypothetical protein FRZ03_20120 [Streptomyces misionensis]|uniref:Uncharacterized protein n=1 Tax=Streptomyces misionensis TaxID=67331 RepID=A0A5C6JK11_9ACTN|nr:hypothetical protein [Streptomyces misionensis]TWV41897.1 hypothetical protein FRZ03_20120 [Streptomyces misionensis]